MIYLLQSYKQWDDSSSSSTTLHSTHFIPNLSISSEGETTLLVLSSRSAHWWGGWRAFPFGNSPVGREAAIEHSSAGELAPLSPTLPNLHHMEGVTQLLETLRYAENSCTQKTRGGTDER